MKYLLIHGCLNDEHGFALLIVQLALAVLTVMGVAAVNTSNFEFKISGNERMARQRFIISDSGWKQAGPFLNALNSPPDVVNKTLKSGDTSYDWDDAYYNTVRNFGSGTDGNTNDTFTGNPDGTINTMLYWYQVVYDSDVPAQGFSEGYRSFQYTVTCNANGQAQVTTGVRKVFKVGY
ncbi:pilus assembly PilX N-terminal domain-containing protein [uncultured Desulfobacter sp.]|uniref:pilus assembly PilX family protein n=1 Tax=uncultured Desulfobacter sp. TaxID=240139 RepID=UPI002AAADACE|nr:pilus assembly PilX N-terminal domain-containing protein [uncultured Desulfobacter sp.]